jgi:DNA helicase-2/ATP-dependent DNA helicase PcrA
MQDSAGILDFLDPEQRQAASAIEGPVAIVAGAGTGKTRTITHRIAYGCHAGGWKPQEVLAITFTSKAAREMQERLEALNISGVNVFTFHAAALRQMQAFWPKVVGTHPPKLETNKLVHIYDAAKTHQVEINQSDARFLSDEIGFAKVSLIPATEYEKMAQEMNRIFPEHLPSRIVAKIYEEYDNIKAERGLVDFEDIILVMIHMISTRKAVAEEIRKSYRHIIVDEYQDVSPLAQSFLDCLLGSSREICVVGDPSQTIYSFTGANPKYLLDFERKYKARRAGLPEVARVELIRDYRSTAPIVELANTVLKLRGPGSFPPLKLVSAAAKTQQKPHPVEYQVYSDDQAEAQAVVQKIEQLINSEDYKAGDFAILTRINMQLDAFEAVLRARKIKYAVKKSSSALIDEVDYSAASPENGAENANAGDVITLASLHSTKGLEFRAVFLCGLSDGNMPISRARTQEDIEEERRLLYVGITRAKERLFMSFARAKASGTARMRKRSRFLDGIWPAG